MLSDIVLIPPPFPGCPSPSLSAPAFRPRSSQGFATSEGFIPLLKISFKTGQERRRGGKTEKEGGRRSFLTCSRPRILMVADDSLAASFS